MDDKRERQNLARAYGTGVGARRGHCILIAIMLLLVLRHPTCASCVAWMCCRMSNSIEHVWACPDQSSGRGHRFNSAIMLFLVLPHPTCASCVAWMCCRMSNSIKHVWACPDLSSRRRHRFLIAIMLFFVLRHPTYHHVLHACVVGCPVLSSMYEHVPHELVPIYHSIVLDSTPSYTFCAPTSHHRVRCSSGVKQLAKRHWHVTYTPCKAPKKT